MASAAYEQYSFDMFEEHQRAAVPAGNAAPLRKEKVREEYERPVLRKVTPKTDAQKRSEEVRNSIRVAVLIVFVGLVFAVICCQISAGAERYELIRQIDAVEAQIDIAKSENVRLNSELNGITSITKIDSYAVDVLGMTKLESYQVECVDLSQGDKILYSGASAEE